ncbi:DsrE family protein [Thiomicrorhabdus indica]|uniref:DsrE family protein n=1 Tax=Thiomicrorhabdus indica TaxID=2267253 RepID=UPI00102DE0A3|nr:DsrE family protein [Thiomicrorhabdus indica]
MKNINFNALFLASAITFTMLSSNTVFADELEKVVYHVDFSQADRFSATLTSVNNMLVEYENAFKDYEVSIVFVGLGARFVTDTEKAGTSEKLNQRRKELSARLKNLHDMKEVKLSVCNNTLKDFGLKDSELYQGVETVPSGVVHLASLQKNGAAYLKIQ